MQRVFGGGDEGAEGVDPRDALGRWGEDAAALWLEQGGFRILGRRVRFGSREELDLVVTDGESLIFVEVRTRTSERYGLPVESVGFAKRRALSRAAVHYVRKLGFRPVFLRFDVVEVIGQMGDVDPVMRRIENAFPLDSRYKLPY